MRPAAASLTPKQRLQRRCSGVRQHAAVGEFAGRRQRRLLSPNHLFRSRSCYQCSSRLKGKKCDATCASAMFHLLVLGGISRIELIEPRLNLAPSIIGFEGHGLNPFAVTRSSWISSWLLQLGWWAQEEGQRSNSS
jgi:hypothetical protein